MANFGVQFGFQTNMFQIDFGALLKGTVVTKTSRIFVVETDGVTIDFRGTGFKYSTDGMPKAGSLAGYAISLGDKEVLHLDGVDLPMKALIRTVSTLSTSDDLDVLLRMLKGKDTIVGAEKSDLLLGGEGNDSFLAQGGADNIGGGGGRDTFRYNSAFESAAGNGDVLFDFSQDQRDRIDISALDVQFIGSSEFSGTGREARFFLDQFNTVVAVDMNNDKVADMEINVSGQMIFQATDFIL